MSIARRGLIAGLAALLGGCSPAALLNTTVPRSGYKLQADIPYGNGPRRTLDFYTPETPRADGLLPGVSHIDIVAAFSDFLHKRATTREDVVEYVDTH